MTKYDVRFWVWAVIALGGALYVGARITDVGKAHYEADAERAADDCIRNKGFGAWVGSSGITLEDFCAGVGDTKALLDHRRDHPEAY